jgi:hypothetical protein
MITNELALTADDLMAECQLCYVPEADQEGGSEVDLSRIANAGTVDYGAGDYFDIDSDTEFASREDGLTALRRAYVGPDRYGIGMLIPAA